MCEYNIISVDLAKSSMQVCITNKHNKIVKNSSLSRQKFEDFIANCPAKAFVLEACATAHYWARRLKRLGFEVTLLDPKYVKSFARRQKNDKNDAVAILTAYLSLNPVTVQIKTEQQQEIQLIIRARASLIKDKVATINEIRATLAEFGVTLPNKRQSTLNHYLHSLLYDNDNTLLAEINLDDTKRFLLESLYQRWLNTSASISTFDKKIEAIVKSIALCQSLMKVPGIGKLCAATLYAAIGNATQFKNGRHLAAYLGLVPRQHSSGETQKLLGVTKQGNTYLRSILIQGAQSVLRHRHKGKTKLHEKALRLKARYKHSNVIVVAIANSMARWAFNAIHKNDDYVVNGL